MPKESLSCSHLDNHIDKFDQMMFANAWTAYDNSTGGESVDRIVEENPAKIARLMEDTVE